MKVGEICSLLNGEMICCGEKADREVEYAFASDLMSDVLTINCDSMLLVTGLANLQTIRTAEMSDVACILFVRGKKVDNAMKELAEELDMCLIACGSSMFRASGELYNAGMKPIY